MSRFLCPRKKKHQIRDTWIIMGNYKLINKEKYCTYMCINNMYACMHTPRDTHIHTNEQNTFKREREIPLTVEVGQRAGEGLRLTDPGPESLPFRSFTRAQALRGVNSLLVPFDSLEPVVRRFPALL